MQIEKSEKQKMMAGELYHAAAPELVADRRRADLLMRAYNGSADDAMRQAKLVDLLGHVGADAEIRSPFYCDYGYNISIGRNVFINLNCVLLDVATITIGDFCQIGSGVQILTPDHPRDAALRKQGLESGRPVRIGENVWIGSGAIILPGVAIADDAIIGAGSIVTRNVPRGATVMGQPARVKFSARSE